MHPYLHDTYHTLGLAHEALGRQRQALDFYMNCRAHGAH